MYAGHTTKRSKICKKYLKHKLVPPKIASMHGLNEANYCPVGQSEFMAHPDKKLNDLYKDLHQNCDHSQVEELDWDLLVESGRTPMKFKYTNHDGKDFATCQYFFKEPSLIYSGHTSMTLKFLKTINPQEYAYAVFYFPSKSRNANAYLISTLLVGYLLRTRPNGIQNQTTRAKTLACVTKEVDNNAVDLLKLVYDEVRVVPNISWGEDADIEIQDISKGNIEKTHAYAQVFTKLNAFNFTEFKKVIILDADLYPLACFDSLFSLNTPAGCLEHRRSLNNGFGLHTWKSDRSLFAAHGEPVPPILTDLSNRAAADINASLLVISPSHSDFRDMIAQLKRPVHKWLNLDQTHSGVWLGDYFYTFYPLPEQNFLTQHFSNKWHSVDFGFSSWCLDLNTCFGFTFAGFIVKPWLLQPANLKYTVNSSVDFSRINNKLTCRSLGCQLFNLHLAKMLHDFPKFKSMVLDIQINLDPFDPWYPETKLDKKIALIQAEPAQLSFDQRILAAVLRNEQTKCFSPELKFLNAFKNIEPVAILNLKKKLEDQIKHIAPVANSSCFSSYSTSVLEYGDPHKVAADLLNQNLRVLLFSNGRFTELATETNKPLYLEYSQTNFSLLDNACFCNLNHINVSFHQTVLHEYYKNNSNLRPVYYRHKNQFYLKSPHIEIFFNPKLNCQKVTNTKLDRQIQDKLSPPNFFKRLFQRT